MHLTAYVLLPKVEATTSLKARKKVATELSNDQTFVAEGGRFADPLCNWFVIGGRASGDLYPQPQKDAFFRRVDELVGSPPEVPGLYHPDFINTNRERLDRIWQELGGKNKSPLTRDKSNDLGEEDDARLLEPWLAEQLNEYLKKQDYARCIRCICSKTWGMPVVISHTTERLFDDLRDFNDLNGQYWVVVIDYHIL